VAQPQQQHLFNTEDLFAANYGDVAVEVIKLKAISDRLWSQIGDLDESAAGCKVLIRGASIQPCIPC
jgi:aspartyl-tRNA synthetase